MIFTNLIFVTTGHPKNEKSSLAEPRRSDCGFIPNDNHLIESNQWKNCQGQVK